MFKNRAVQMKFVRADKDTTEVTGERDILDGPNVAAAYAEVAKDFITHAALTVGGVYVACKVVGRICK